MTPAAPVRFHECVRVSSGRTPRADFVLSLADGGFLLIRSPADAGAATLAAPHIDALLETARAWMTRDIDQPGSSIAYWTVMLWEIANGERPVAFMEEHGAKIGLARAIEDATSWVRHSTGPHMRPIGALLLCLNARLAEPDVRAWYRGLTFGEPGDGTHPRGDDSYSDVQPTDLAAFADDQAGAMHRERFS